MAKLNLKKAPVRVPKKQVVRRRKDVPIRIIFRQKPAEKCYCWEVLGLMFIALGLMATYAGYHAKTQYLKGIHSGACTWELTKDIYPSGQRYQCITAIGNELDDVRTVEINYLNASPSASQTFSIGN